MYGWRTQPMFFTLLNCQLAALASRDTKPISLFCIKTNGAPPSSTHACMCYNPPCPNRVVFAAVANKIQDAAVAWGPSAFLHGWMPMANPWQCPIAINSGSMAIMVHFSSQENPSIVRCYKYKDLISWNEQIQTAYRQQVMKKVKTTPMEANYSLKKQVQLCHKVTIFCFHKWKPAQIREWRTQNIPGQLTPASVLLG